MAQFQADYANFEGPKHSKAADKTAYVEQMFDEVAPTYDLANRVMSAGIDILWRRRIVRESGLTASGRLLDLCCGTGDVIFEFARQMPDLKIDGLDLSAKMLELAAAKNRWPHISFRKGNVLKLPWKKARYSAITMAYGLRSITDQVKCFKEQKRLLNKGGRVLCLELSRPSNRLVRALYWPVLSIYIPVVGRLLSGHATGYEYLKETIKGFYEPEVILRFMKKAGLKNVRAIPLTFGTATLYIGDA